jgi:hypothetical protein
MMGGGCVSAALLLSGCRCRCSGCVWCLLAYFEGWTGTQCEQVTGSVAAALLRALGKAFGEWLLKDNELHTNLKFYFNARPLTH